MAAKKQIKKETTYIFTVEITNTVFDDKEPDVKNIEQAIKMAIMADDVHVKSLKVFDKEAK